MRYVIGAYSQFSADTAPEVLEKLATKHLRNLLTMLYGNPDRTLVLRLSITESEFLESRHPEFNMLIAELCRKGQLELLSSPYYDAMLPLVMPHERAPQVEKATTYIRKRYSKRPRGLWCPYQVFSPFVASSLPSCGLEYIMMSTWCSQLGRTIADKPVYMSEMGKGALIIPTDDKLSQAIAKASSTKQDKKSLLQTVSAIASSGRTDADVRACMVNLDQLLYLDDSLGVFNALYEGLGQTDLPMTFAGDFKPECVSYLPSGVYGFDCDAAKWPAINSYIASRPMLCRTFARLNMLRDAIRDTKKNTDERKRMDALFQKASCGALYAPGVETLPGGTVSRSLCEIESVLSDMDCLPLQADTDGDGEDEFFVTGPNFICNLREKGALITHMNLVPQCVDIADSDGPGLFVDSFSTSGFKGEETDLSQTRYDISPADRRRTDFFAYVHGVKVKKGTLNLTKRYKFRQNTVIADIEIENGGESAVSDVTYACKLFLSLPGKPVFKDQEGQDIGSQGVSTQNLQARMKDDDISLNIALGENMTVSATDGAFTEIRISRKFSLKPMEAIRFVVGLRTDRYKENTK